MLLALFLRTVDCLVLEDPDCQLTVKFEAAWKLEPTFLSDLIAGVINVLVLSNVIVSLTGSKAFDPLGKVTSAKDAIL